MTSWAHCPQMYRPVVAPATTFSRSRAQKEHRNTPSCSIAGPSAPVVIAPLVKREAVATPTSTAYTLDRHRGTPPCSGCQVPWSAGGGWCCQAFVVGPGGSELAVKVSRASRRP